MGRRNRRRQRRGAGPGHQVAGKGPASSPPPGEVGAQRFAWIWPLVVLSVALACYANSLEGVLLFDDLNSIVKNRLVREGDVGRIFSTASWWGELGYGRLYRPITTLSFAANYLLGGIDPAGYHLVNLLLHAAVSLLLFRLFGKLSGSSHLAFLAALLFAAHPVHTEAVTSVVGRAEELAALFALASWLFLLKARAAEGRQCLWLPAASVTLATGFLAKESAGTILGAIVCADLIYYRRHGERILAVLRRWLPQYVALLGGLVLVVILRTLVLGEIVTTPDTMDNVIAKAPLAAHYLTAVAVVGLYAARLFWPFRLSADYSYPQIELVSSPFDPAFVFGLLLIVAAAGLFWWSLGRRPVVAFSLAFSASTFVLASNMVITIGTIMAERLLYLPSAGFCLLVACAVEGLARRLVPQPRKARIGALLCVVLLTAAWGRATWVRNRIWLEPRVFFEAMVRDAPRSARSHRELALVYSRLGRHEDALAEMKRSLALKPDDATTLYNLGNVMMRAGRYQEAIGAYTRSLARKPDFVQAMTNLGNAYSAVGDEASARRWFENGLRLAPGSALLNMNLANSLFRQGLIQEAEERYRRAARLDPRSANIHRNYASLLYATGRYQEAAEQYRQAAALDPASPAAYVGLIAALASAGKNDEARQVQARAARLFPSDPGLLRMKMMLEREKGS